MNGGMQDRDRMLGDRMAGGGGGGGRLVYCPKPATQPEVCGSTTKCEPRCGI